jgi:hypothetical protein
MSQHDPLVALRHMLDHAREAADLARGTTRAELEAALADQGRVDEDPWR